MRIKIITGIISIIVALTALVGSTAAHFLLPCKVNATGFKTGTLDLQLSEKLQRRYNSVLQFEIIEENIAPAFTRTYQYKLDNSGSIDGSLNISNIKVKNNELGLTDAEQVISDTDLTGELGDRVKITMSYMSGGAIRKIYSGKINDISTASLLLADEELRAGESVELIIRLDWPPSEQSDIDNIAQSDKVTLLFDLALAQD